MTASCIAAWVHVKAAPFSAWRANAAVEPGLRRGLLLLALALSVALVAETIAAVVQDSVDYAAEILDGGDCEAIKVAIAYDMQGAIQGARAGARAGVA